jgi:hypothetical protein
MGGTLITDGDGAHAQLDDCSLSGAFLGDACLNNLGRASVVLRKCTLQVMVCRCETQRCAGGPHVQPPVCMMHAGDV